MMSSVLISVAAIFTAFNRAAFKRTALLMSLLSVVSMQAVAQTDTNASGANASLPTTVDQMPVATLSVGIHRLQVEVANNPQRRQVGLMNRKSLPPNTGMLFVFEAPALQCMWMKNTYLPLSVAFIDENSRILNIEDMAPQTETSHCSAGASLFAIEMPKGWFKKNGINVGDAIQGDHQRP